MVNNFTCSALWGDLLRDPEIAEAFSARRFTARMIAFERAWTAALVSVGQVDAETGAAALAALDRFQPDFDALGTATNVDGLPVPALVQQIRAGLSETAHCAIHTGATSQDVIDTAMVLTLRSILQTFQARGDGILRQLDEMTRRFGANPVMGRTRMQAALPVTARERIENWRTPFAAHIGALPGLVRQVAVVQIGGPVGLRASPPALAEAAAGHLARTLDLRLSPVWHTDRTTMLETGHWLTKTAGTLGKIGQDIALMSQQGIDEAVIEGAGTSSAMPHKQNPVRAEILVALARVIGGHQGTLAQAMLHEQERSGAAWAIEWMTLPAMIEATGAAMNNADQLLRQIRHLGQQPGG